MIIIPEKPPNFEQIAAVFPIIREQKGILYCWEDRIYNPDKVPVPVEIEAHEAAHSVQQYNTGGAQSWWDAYLASQEFRFTMELQAHQIEYLKTKYIRDREKRAKKLVYMARRLSSPLYGNMVSYQEALKLIRLGGKQ
jgi:hypothetical protein